MASAFKLNPQAQAKWRAALRELAEITKKDSPEGLHKLVKLSARRFVKNVASVTPPASGTLDAEAKKKGENAILGDLLKIALPVVSTGSKKQTAEVLATAQDLIEAHARARINSSGRVNPRNRREKLFVAQADFQRVLVQLQAKVGWLAAGLNAAAEKLGFSLPAWIKRHGEKFGKIEVKETAFSIAITVVQDVPFTDQVAGYPKHFNFALDKEIHALEAQVKAIHDKQARRAAGHLR